MAVQGWDVGSEQPGCSVAPNKGCEQKRLFIIIIIIFFCLFAFSRAAPAAHGGSQARSQIGAVAAGLGQSHSNAGFELGLQPKPQLTATPDP